MMKLTDRHINRFKQALRDESLRFTSQRMAILEDIISSEEHRECDHIYLSLREKQIPVSRATIYRTLDILENIGFIRKMDVGDGRYRYENKLSQGHHDHMICIECGRIIEFIDDEIEKRQAQICRENQFRLIRHVHQLFGLCADCHRPDGKSAHA